jgi:hypothetical protein
MRAAKFLLPLFGVLMSLEALASPPAYDFDQLESAIVERFVKFANDPSSYAYEMIKQSGMATPITREQLSLFPTFKEELTDTYCDENKLCVIHSLKEVLLIGIPTVVQKAGGTKMEMISFTMKGGFKTICKGDHCELSSVFYFPEDVDIIPRYHGVRATSR